MKTLQVCHLGVIDIYDKPITGKKNQGGLCLEIVGANKRLVLFSQSNDLEMFHSGRLERLRPNEGERRTVEK